MLEAALIYASWGWHIHPLRPGDKRPLLADWPRRATTDPARIRRWWQRWPRANIGLACGPSGLLAVDLDVKNGVDGLAAWEALAAELGIGEAGTPASDTPSGGRHLLFALAEGTPAGNTAGRLAPGIDTRGDGGYIVLPPSRLRGPDGGASRAWAWRSEAHPRDCRPQPLPEAVWRRLGGRGAGIGEQVSGIGARGAGAYGQAALREERQRVAGAARGTRNNALNAAAFSLGQLVGAGLLARGEVEESLVLAARAAGLGEAEARATARSGLDAGQKQPRRCGTGSPAAGGGPNSLGGGPRQAGESTEAGIGERVSGIGERVAEEADDEGNAQCVVRMHGGRFLYCDAYGWLHYTGSHWIDEGAKAALERAIVATLRARCRQAVQSDRPSLAKAARPTAHHVRAASFLLSSLLYADVADFDASPDHLNVANGVLDLRSGELAPHGQAQRFTYCLEAEYDPGVDYRPWQDWLRRTLASDGDGRGKPGEAEAFYLQLAMGYSLTGHTSEEVLFYLYGPPRSGKGTFAEALLTLLGHEPLATEVSFGTFTRRRDYDQNSADLAQLKPCRLVVASEPGRAEWLNAAEIKRLTGGNLVYAALKYRDHFAYRPAYKIWLTSNYPPRADVDDDAVWSRLRVIPFPNSYVGREDRGLKARMKQPEMQRQILAWAVDGARAWYRTGARGLSTPPGIEAATRAARDALDHVAQWLAECVTVTGAGEDFVPNAALHASYEAWCQEMGARPHGITRLTQALKAKGLAAGSQRWHAGRNQRGCTGVQLV